MAMLLKAAEARAKTVKNPRLAQKITIYNLKDALDVAIVDAISRGLTQATVKVPASVSSKLLQAFKVTLTKLGYGVKSEKVDGVLEGGLFIEPTTMLTIYW